MMLFRASSLKITTNLRLNYDTIKENKNIHSNSSHHALIIANLQPDKAIILISFVKRNLTRLILDHSHIFK